MAPRRYEEDDYDDEEFEELDRSTEASSFLERRWWRWAAIAIALLVLASLLLPVLLPLLGNDEPEQPPGLAVPNFTLPSPNHGQVTLADVVTANDYVVLVFYRTFN